MKDKIELTEEMVNTLDNPPKANDAFKAAAKKYKGEDIKMADVFGTSIYDDPVSRLSSSIVLYGPEKDAAIHAISNHDKLVKQVTELRAALESVKLHQEKITPSGFEFSSVWQVANKALEENQ